MKTTSLFFMVFTFPLFLSGCDQAKKLSGVTEVDNRIAALEIQVANLQNKVSNTGQWILWQRFVDHRLFGYTPAQAGAAFATKSECTGAANAQMIAGGTKVTDDPIQIEYQNGTQYFYCLPLGVTAGIQSQNK